MKTNFKAGDNLHIDLSLDFSITQDNTFDTAVFKRNLEKYISLNLEMLLGFKSYKFDDLFKKGVVYGEKKTNG